MSAPFKYDVFFSYSSKDELVVHALAERLKDDGLRIWLDDWVIKPGDPISIKIEEGLEQSQTLILAMSPAAFKSEWVKLERHSILFRDPTNKDRRFIPLLITNCTPPGMIAQFAHVDWRTKSIGSYNILLDACRQGNPSDFALQNKDYVVEGPSPFNVVGAIPPDNESYVERECDRELEDLILGQGFICIQGENELGKSSLLHRRSGWLPSGWEVAVLGLGLYRRSMEDFEDDFFDELQENLGRGLNTWLAVKSRLNEAKIVFLIDEIWSCDAHIARMFIERLHTLFSRLPDHVRVVIALDKPIEEYLFEIGMQRRKYFEVWQTVTLERFTAEQAMTLLQLFPPGIEAALRKKFPRIQTITGMTPKTLQQLLSDVWEYLHDHSGGNNTIARFLDQY